MANEDEIRIVRRAIVDDESSAMSISKLKKVLRGKVDEKVMMEALDVLDRENKIYIGLKGVTWIYNRSPKLRKAIREGIDFDELRRKLAEEG